VVHHRRKDVGESLEAEGRATADGREDTSANDERVRFALSLALDC